MPKFQTVRKFTQDDLLKLVVKALRPKYDLGFNAFDGLAAIDNLHDHRFPFPLHSCVVCEHRLNVIPSILMPSRKNPLAEMLVCGPGTPVVAKDAAMEGLKGVFFVYGGADHNMTASWVRAMRPVKLIVGESEGIIMIGAPVLSFVDRAVSDSGDI